MTYVFEFRLPNVQEGSSEAEKEMQKFKGVSTPTRCSFEFVTNEMTDGEEGSREQHRCDSGDG
jgi:hypothetical protein